MIKTIHPAMVSGTINAPSSKSYLQRAIAAALLAKGTTTLPQITHCDDTLAACEVAKHLGATITQQDNTLIIKGGFEPDGAPLHCGEAGLCSRMFTSIAALHHDTLTLTGEGSLVTRPFEMIVAPLAELGANCVSNEGKIPLQITGKLKGGTATIDGSLSSQFLTGLLMALPVVEKDSTVHVQALKSKPYIDMTLETLEGFGIDVTHDNYATFHIKGQQNYQANTFQVEGDWSGAAFLLVAGAINGDLKIGNLKLDSQQADRAIMDALKLAGADITIKDNHIFIKKSALKAFNFDATECPDLFPPLAALAAYCEGTTTIKGALRLTHKESDRATALYQEFGKMGIKVEVDGDLMSITGGQIQSATIFSHEDHRIAMAAATAALGATGAITIEHSECVAKSYPHFYEDLESLVDN